MKVAPEGESMNIGRNVPPITVADFEPVIGGHRGVVAFKRALGALTNVAALLRTLGQFVQFNSVFGAGVAALAGGLAARQDLFRDRDESVDALADRSLDVAAGVFFAAIDEYGDPSRPGRCTHRALAQATLRGFAEVAGQDGSSLARLLEPAPATRTAITRVADGYGIGKALSPMELLTAVGFHIGSELLADREFGALDRFLRERHPELVAALKARRVSIGAQSLPTYTWISIHTTVEAEHRDAGIDAANRAVRYYAGSAGPSAARACILDGFESFCRVQQEFLESLSSNVPASSIENEPIRGDLTCV